MLLALACFLAAAAPAGELAFVGATEGAASRVHVLTFDTRALRPIGPEGASGRPAWSPDGARIAFEVNVDGATRIFLADASGAHDHPLDHAHTVNRGPVWSPSGDRIAYTASTGLDACIVVADTDGNERVWGGGRTSLSGPAWVSQSAIDLLLERLDPGGRVEALRALLPRPDAPHVLVATGLTGAPDALTTDLYLVSETEALPFPPRLLPSTGIYEEFAPVAARDMLAFESNDGGDREIFLMNRRGVWDLSNHPAADWRPLWSPDGKWLSFESFRGGTRGVYRCHKQTTRVLAVVADPTSDAWDATWSPDGRWIAYTTDRDGAPAVWAARVAGAERVRVSPLNLRAGQAAWRPGR